MDAQMEVGIQLYARMKFLKFSSKRQNEKNNDQGKMMPPKVTPELQNEWDKLDGVTKKAYQMLQQDLNIKGIEPSNINPRFFSRQRDPPTPIPPRHEVSYFMFNVQEDYFAKHPTSTFAQFKDSAEQKWSNLDKKKKKQFILKAAADLKRHADEVENIKVVAKYNILLDELKPQRKRRTAPEAMLHKKQIQEKREMKQRHKKLKQEKRKLMEERKTKLTPSGRKKRALKKWDAEVPKISHAKGPYACFFGERWQQLKLYKQHKMTYRSSIIGNFAKETGRLWKALSEEEKKKYYDMSMEARKEKLKEVDEWWEKHPNGPEILSKYKPVAARSAMIYYMVDEKIKSWQAGAEETHESFKKTTQARWAKLPDWMKQPYEEKAKEDMIRFERENFDFEWVDNQRKLMVERYNKCKAEGTLQVRNENFEFGSNKENETEGGIPAEFQDENEGVQMKDDENEEEDTDDQQPDAMDTPAEEKDGSSA